MKLDRRDFITSIVAAATAGIPNVWAQNYPSRPARIVLPFPPGGSADSLARLLSERLGKRLGQSFVVENRPGAGGNIGADVVAKASPDGYTLLMGPAGALAINKSLYPKLPYDPLNDFVPVTLVGYTPVLIAAHPSAPASTVKELIVAAKAAPGSIQFASNGTGTVHHLAAEMFMSAAKVEMTHIPYKGTAGALQDIVAGRIPYGFIDLTSSLPMLKSGRLKAIATTGLKRTSAIPGVPTVAESGLPGFEAVGWFGIFGPKGMPQSVVNQLNHEVNAILADREAQARAAELAVNIQTSTPGELQKYQAAEIEKWAAIVKAAKVTLD